MTEIVNEENNTHINTSYDDETILWEGCPSQWVNFNIFLLWIIILSALVFFVFKWNSGLSDGYQPYVLTAVSYGYKAILVIGILKVLHSYLSVSYEYTTVTANKIKESKGITPIFRQSRYCEISDITDIKGPPAGLLGILGLSTLLIETKDEDQPIIKIRAIRDREHLIQTLQPIWRKLKVDRKGYFAG